jgi:hypothetical protein
VSRLPVASVFVPHLRHCGSGSHPGEAIPAGAGLRRDTYRESLGVRRVASQTPAPQDAPGQRRFTQPHNDGRFAVRHRTTPAGWGACGSADAEALRCSRPLRPVRLLSSLGGCSNFHTGRGVAQPGSALAWGASGRWFKSSRPDHCFCLTGHCLGNPGSVRYPTDHALAPIA